MAYFENFVSKIPVNLVRLSFFQKLGNTGNFLCHLAFHHEIDLPDSPRRFLVSYPPQKHQYFLFGCNEWSPMWISYRYVTSLDNFGREVLQFHCCYREYSYAHGGIFLVTSRLSAYHIIMQMAY